MPHGARIRSNSGYYHVVPKGVGDQIIFEDDEDRSYYRYLLVEAKNMFDVAIPAYCLMSNHVHLVIEDRVGCLPAFMKYVHERYGAYCAHKMGRTGGIFAKPYWSEPIETNRYLLDAVRYVHANPAAAGICPASRYEWSSAKDYLGREGLADTEMVLTLAGGREGFIAFSRAIPMPAKAFEKSRLRAHLTDDEVIRVAKSALGETALESVKSAGPDRAREHVRRLAACGLTLRQVVRATGLGYNFVQRAWPR